LGPKGIQRPQTTPAGLRATSNCSHMSRSHIHRSPRFRRAFSTTLSAGCHSEAEDESANRDPRAAQARRWHGHARLLQVSPGFLGFPGSRGYNRPGGGLALVLPAHKTVHQFHGDFVTTPQKESWGIRGPAIPQRKWMGLEGRTPQIKVGVLSSRAPLGESWGSGGPILSGRGVVIM
jgi:hypothetical protein